MKIGMLISGSCSINRTDQWVTGRCEVRCGINAGYGFALMGHEVDIVCPSFIDADNVFPGVSLRKNWDITKEYDVLWTWAGNPGFNLPSNHRMAIVMVEPSNKKETLVTIQSRISSGKIYTLSKKCIPLLRSNYGIDLNYFPSLYPIPCLPGIVNQDFLPFDFDRKKKDINVFVFLNSWPSYHINCDQRIVDVLRRLRDNHGYRMNVSVMIGGNNVMPIAGNTIVQEFKATALSSDNMCYLDVMNVLRNSDICITKGGWCYCGNCAYDIISLGKLMIYCTEGKSDTNINDLYPLDRWVIRHEEGTTKAYEKADRILSDPEACYNDMKKELITYSFPEWSKIVGEILSEIQ